jgi:hypothetical protein
MSGSTEPNNADKKTNGIAAIDTHDTINMTAV